jgi:Cu-Zn family superoxide dismutase
VRSIRTGGTQAIGRGIWVLNTVRHFRSKSQQEDTMHHHLQSVVIVSATVLTLGTGISSGEVIKAIARLEPTEGHTARGAVYFQKMENGIRVRAHVTGLTEGLHGFHIHEVGDCSAPDASSAGPHFNPGSHEHGGPDAEERHAGDLGNLDADADGEASYERMDTMLTFEGERSIIGRSVIVHVDPDDLTSQPTGNAGGRVACGVIEVQETAVAVEAPAEADEGAGHDHADDAGYHEDEGDEGEADEEAE